MYIFTYLRIYRIGTALAKVRTSLSIPNLRVFDKEDPSSGNCDASMISFPMKSSEKMSRSNNSICSKHLIYSEYF